MLSDDDQAKLAAARGVVAEAEAGVSYAKTVTIWRARRVASAEAVLKTAQEEYTRIESEVEKAARDRLLHADFEGSFLAYETQVHEARDILQRRLVEVIDELLV